MNILNVKFKLINIIKLKTWVYSKNRILVNQESSKRYLVSIENNGNALLKVSVFILKKQNI